MAEAQQIESLIAALDQSVKAGVAYFRGPGSHTTVTVGRWEARHVLCHLVWWHQVTAEGIESVNKGGAPYRIYASVDEMNARAAGRQAGLSIEQLAQRVEQHQASLAQAARACADPNATVLVMGDGSGRSVVQRLEAMTAHWNEHVKELQTLSAA
ncbi:MAG: hypothetical protein FJZ47_23695 [Candidatus Tectomicrobia bacterium]|uniref:Mycothiol-dependent maleylpyruvate isomerase metal-binding domain-containing protein n=1 Tax=Tectimicrobiota bacterium TaxID=2528274 RepID=A0A937W7A3_UNCTE|nr:hypothetical protein [Candidatus Tectomicrobia bacterium]